MYTPRDTYNLYEILQKADGGDFDAMSTAVSLMVVDGYMKEGANADIYERYTSYLCQMAQAGKTEAYIMLGDAYLLGQGAEKNPLKAISWYEKAVDAGVGFGNECIGMMYFMGNGIEADYEKAYLYFTKDTGDKSFCTIYSLGEMYRKGLYVKQSDKLACEYYEDIVYSNDLYREADVYFGCACYRLGKALHYGNGVEQDLQTALELLVKAKETVDNDLDAMKIAGIASEEVFREWFLLNQDAGKF